MTLTRAASKMNDIDGLSADGKLLLAAMRQEFNQMKAEMTAIVNAKNEEISVIKSEMVNLRGQLNKLRGEIDDAEAYSRWDCLVFSGNLFPSSTPGEGCSKVVMNTLKKELKINVDRSEISAVHRLGPKPLGEGADNRKIIAKFVRRDMKKDILIASKKVKNLYANESLTQIRSSILFTIRKIKRGHADIIKGYTTIDGNIYVFTPSTSASSGHDVRHMINSKEKLTDFCRTHVKKELEIFLESWQK